jgi:Uma2 family endonuclease
MKMLARSQIGVEEYLDLVFDDRPEPDYVDGVVVERALPTPIHSRIQGLLIFLLAPLLSRAQLFFLPELRAQIGPRRFRVADLAVYRDSAPQGRYGTTPAFVAVEIVSPDDRYSKLTHRLEDYRCWGGPMSGWSIPS